MQQDNQQSPQSQPADTGPAAAPAPQGGSVAGAHRAGLAERAKAEAIGLLIEALEAKVAGIPLPADPLGEAGQKYDALVAWYQKHITAARGRLMAMGH